MRRTATDRHPSVGAKAGSTISPYAAAIKKGLGLEARIAGGCHPAVAIRRTLPGRLTESPAGNLGQSGNRGINFVAGRKVAEAQAQRAARERAESRMHP